MATGKYERELKGILSAEKETLEKVTKTCSEDEIEQYHSVTDIPFMVVRAAGSLGIDLIAIRGELSFPIEVKSSKEDVLYFSDKERLTEQVEWIEEECSNSGVLPLYAFRLKGQRGDKWSIFTMDISNLSKKHRVVQRKIPTLEETTHGNYKISWEKGMPLNRFVSYLRYILK